MSHMARKPSRTAGRVISADTRICVLYGAERMLIRLRLEELRETLTKAHGEVETIAWDGKTAALSDVLDELRSYGLIQQHKIVIVDEADKFAATHRQALERYAAKPVDHATLVLRSTRWNKGKIDKLIEKVGCIIKCDQLSDAQASKWLLQRAEQTHRCRLHPRTAAVLIQRLGKDLGRLDAAVAKLALTVQPGETIDEKEIDRVVGRGSDEQAWAVQEAFLHAIASGASPRQTGDAIAKLHEIIDLAGQAEVLVAYFVADVIRKLYLARQMRKQGVGEGQIARQLKIWPQKRQEPFFAALGRLSEAQTGRLFDAVMDRILRARSSRGNTTRNLEGFATELTDLVSQGR